MKRRFFVQSSTLGTIGLGFVSTELLSISTAFENMSVSKWLSELNWTLSVQRRAQARYAPESFSQIVGEKNEYLSHRGYHKINDNCYFFGENEEYCFYPVVARHKPSGISDVLLPVFRRNIHDQWQPVQTLSGFQVEALMKASYSLRENSSTTLRDWLFPVGRNMTQNSPGSYATKEGIVSVITSFKNGKAITSCTITNRTGKIFNETFISKHSLNC